jgi:hypothetical protein
MSGIINLAAGQERGSSPPRGPIAPRGGDLPRIQLDLTADGRVVLPSIIRPVSHPYSDAPAEGNTALCYVFEELFGEKVRLRRLAFRSPDRHPAQGCDRSVARDAIADPINASVVSLYSQRCTGLVAKRSWLAL